MSENFRPLQLLMAILAGWIDDDQRLAVEHLREENRVLKEQLGGKRLRLTDDERRRLAVRGKELGRKLLREFVTIVTRDTILAIGYWRDFRMLSE